MAQDLSDNRGCLGGLFGAPNAAPKDESLPYRLRDDFMSPAERGFHEALLEAVAQRLVVCPKVNMADIFFVVKPSENPSARGRIAQKHLDFLLCDPGTMRPLLGIELDDASHSRPDRVARDEFVDKAFQAARLPLLHVPVRLEYSVKPKTVG